MDVHAITAFFAHIPMDWIILAAFAVLVAFDALRSGLGRSTAFALALPLTLIFVEWAPQARLLGDIQKQFASPLLQAAFVGVIFIALFIICYRITDTFGSGSQRPLQALLAGISSSVILATVWLQIPALSVLWHGGTQVTALFGAAYAFWWLIAGLLALAFVRG